MGRTIEAGWKRNETVLSDRLERERTESCYYADQLEDVRDSIAQMSKKEFTALYQNVQGKKNEEDETLPRLIRLT